MLRRRRTLRQDGVAGLVLGVQSVPDGLATGLLAGVNPLAGLYAYMVGTIAGALVTSSAFMVVQGTGAMAIVIADVPAVQGAEGERALFMLAILTGLCMLGAGLLRLGSMLRFVSNAVMVGFINAVGVNIVLGQLGNLTGYAAEGPNRVVRAVDTILSPAQLDWTSVAIGVGTIAGVLLLEKARAGGLGLVVAVVAASAAAYLFGLSGVATLDDLGVAVDGLPTPAAPALGQLPVLIIPALSLAFVALIQGAAISANFPNPDGRYPDASRDFVGQGVANIASGFLRGMPVGGSLSASSLSRAAGAQSRLAPVVAGLVMLLTIVLLGDVIGKVAMPALAGLLILIGVRTVKPADLVSVWRTGTVQKAVLVVTFVLTMLIPLQYSVLVGVGLSVVLHVVRQSNTVTIRRRVYDEDGHVVETDPAPELPAGEVVVLQPYGSLFFAAAPVFEAALPAVGKDSRHTVVILRLRGRSDLGTTFMDVLRRYALSLAEVDSRLVLVSASERIQEQLAVTGVTAVIGTDAIYPGDERVGATLRRAYDEAGLWVAARAAEDDG
jgi:SulP family sulfate permease